MTRRDDVDPQLAALLREAVAGVEPSDRLGELRARTSAPARPRPALLALGGAVLGGAALVTAVAVLGPDVLPTDEPGPATSSPTAPEPTDTSGAASATPSAPPVARRAVAGYYLGESPSGVRLYREFRSTDAPDDGPAVSLDLLVTSPQDPDYRTLWPAGAFGAAEVADDRITVDLADETLAERPEGTSPEEAEASVQQVVYTLQAHAQQQLPVEFTIGGDPADQVLGTSIDGPVARVAPLQALSLVNLSDPEEAASVSGTLVVRGVANSNEANVPWTLQDATGQVVDQGFFTAEGWMGERLFPFSGRIDVSSLAAGTYSVKVETDDPSGGAEGPGAFSDNRTVVVE